MLFQRKRKLFHLRLIILSHLCGFCFYEPTIDVNGIPPMVQQGKWYLLAEGWLTGNHEELLAHGRDSLKGRRTELIHLFCIGEYGRCFLKNRKGWMSYLGNKEQRFQPGECLVERWAWSWTVQFCPESEEWWLIGGNQGTIKEPGE